MPTDIHERAPGLWPRFVGLLAAIRWEAQFKVAKCCMRASISMSDLGVFCSGRSPDWLKMKNPACEATLRRG
jgi:hypothetical protein